MKLRKINLFHGCRFTVCRQWTIPGMKKSTGERDYTEISLKQRKQLLMRKTLRAPKEK